MLWGLRSLMLRTCANAIILAFSFVSVATALAAPTFTLIPLPDGPDGNSFFVEASGINNHGQVVGTYFRGGFTPFIWSQADGMQTLQAPPLTDEMVAVAINDNGVAVGFDQGGYGIRWPGDGTSHRLGGIPGDFLGRARDINNVGQIVGEYNDPYLWNPVDEVKLFDFGPSHGGDIHGINDLGQVAGFQVGPPGNVAEAIIWSESAGMQIIGVPDGFYEAGAWDINNAGLVLGNAYPENTNGSLPGSPRTPFVWSQSVGFQVIDLHYADANALNERGEVVGRYDFRTDEENEHWGFYWTAESGAVDIQTLIDDTGDGWEIYSLTDINDQGQIIGYGKSLNGPNPDRQRSFLLVPVPEPGSLTLIAMGASLCAISAVRNRVRK